MGFVMLFIVGFFLAVYFSHPFWKNWGATPEELNRVLPGDEWHTPDWVCSTRSVTIHAPTSCIWPWICQIGQGRGGFYSYTFLENLLGRYTQNANWLHPEWQQLATGDIIPLDNKGGLVIWDQQPNHYLLLAATPETRIGRPIQSSPRTTWLFFLDPREEKKTRLLVRSGTICRIPPQFRALFSPIVNLATLIMEWKMLYSIRQYAEDNACVPGQIATTN